jgi:hypothetical protein
MSSEYITSLAIVLVGVLKLFKIDIGTEIISALIISILGVYGAFKRYQKGDITIGGFRK